jgi:hypothetical protein
VLHPLQDLLVIENITSETCLAPFAADEVASILSLVDFLISKHLSMREVIVDYLFRQ